ncbi:SET domain-containing protein SmydA-8-like isoform X2 [Daktulosphaira vitifoliae]|uniref:SET domain-containing protein SmydA-8-like isoform X2 n=1 Tax=Daktulosphaira vitifoliae TaxID=58002 RepID=UPI0021AA9301|nr:SET domain-containing protein SmydA-8-like isoform X2 [Daktulosphaira vitifoliae]
MDADSLTKLNNSIAQYLLSENDSSDMDGWTVSENTVAGRGLIATKNYNPGEVIFMDVPLIKSPRVLLNNEANKNLICAVCFQNGPLQACSGGCRWPVCNTKCAKSKLHTVECAYIRCLRPNSSSSEWSIGLYNAVAAVRGLTMFKEGSYNYFYNTLQKNTTVKPVFEVEELKKNVKSKLNQKDEVIMQTVCKIMDANAFEVVINQVTSLRGLYPVASFMNHSCVPNTMHNFDNKLRMVVKASVPIKKNQEITTSYTHLIWSTPLRQHHLLVSKQFLCTCFRCRDPKEFGTELAALNCTKINCHGRILSVNPLDKAAVWQCKVCSKLVSDTEVAILHKTVGSLLTKMYTFHPKTIDAFIEKNNINKNSPFAVDLKLQFVWKTNNSKMTLEQLIYKENSCIDILNLIQKLNLGKCRLMVNKELFEVMNEKRKRYSWDPQTLQVFEKKMNILKEEFTTILNESIRSIKNEE